MLTAIRKTATAGNTPRGGRARGRAPLAAILTALTLLTWAAGAGAVLVDAGDGTGDVGEWVAVPIYADDLTGLGIYSYELHLTWNSAYATCLVAAESGTITEPWGPVITNIGDGSVHIVAAGSTPLTGDGTLIYLVFVFGPSSGNRTLTMAEALFNEGEPIAETANGMLYVLNPPVINISPNSGEIVVGETLEFNCNGGTPPYVYTSSDPAVADFSGNLMTGLAPGSVRATSEDDDGTTDTTTGFIDVRALRLTVGNEEGMPGGLVVMPITVSDTTPFDLRAFEFSLNYNESDLTAVAYSVYGSLIDSGDWTPIFNAGDGTLRFTAAGSQPLAGAGLLASIVFLVNDISYSHFSTVTPADGIFDETYVPLHEAGGIQVNAFPALTVSPNTGTIVVGDDLQFSVSGGGTPPYSWGVTDPLLADIDGTGLLTALAGGEIQVFVEDDLSASDSTDTIRICDLYLSIPRDTLFPGTPVLVPITPDRPFDGLEIYGYEIDLGFDDQRVQVLDVVSAGSASESWGGATFNVMENRVIVVHAGAEPLSGGLPLIYLRMEATIDLYGSYSYLSFEDLLFNEGSPCALTTDGYLELPTGLNETPSLLTPRLYQNYPNPFNPRTRIDYWLPAAGQVRLRVIGADGCELIRLMDRWHDGPGYFSVDWDGHDAAGRRVASGVYFIRLESEKGLQQRKLLLLK